jgi:hypothetical protein
MPSQRIKLICLLVAIVGVLGAVLPTQATEYEIDLRRAGYYALGSDFDYERGLYYKYDIWFPASDTSRTLWLLIDLDGKREWQDETVRPGATGWTVEARSRSSEGLPEGPHTLRISVYEDPAPPTFLGSVAGPPGYRTGEVSVPDDWVLCAADSISFQILPADLPASSATGIWISSTPLGAEIYMAPASAVRGQGGERYDVSKAITDAYYLGAAPVWIEAAPGDYVVVALIPAEEALDLQFDDAYSRFVMTSQGEVSRLGLVYEITRRVGELCTLIASYQLEGVPLGSSFLWLPDDPLYSFNSAALISRLLEEGITRSEAHAMISILEKTGKAAVETQSRRIVVDLRPGGWRIRVYG